MTVWQEVKSEMLSAIFDVLNFNCFYQRDPKFNKILLNVKCCFSVIEMNEVWWFCQYLSYFNNYFVMQLWPYDKCIF